MKIITKLLFFFLFSCFLITPIIVKANIICNDGETSPTCEDCHKGCCSGHGGCTDNPNHSNSGSNSNNKSNSNSYFKEDEDYIKDDEVKNIILNSSVAVSIGTLFVYLCALLSKKGSVRK